jgi:glucose-1-phosphate thymidylyltransferase
MKGIILAGGSGTRLYPLTISVSKQLLPVFDKPMIYYPLSTLLMAGIKEVLIITTPKDNNQFISLLGDGSTIGCKIEYEIQENPNGLAEAFIIGEKFIGNDDVCLILGDNIFYGSSMDKILQLGIKPKGGVVFAYHVRDPERYGVVEFDENYSALSVEEKPVNPKSNYAIPGLYFYDNSVVKIAKSLKPSKRGELEITDLNKVYLENKKLFVKVIDRGTAWLDTGTFESLQEANQFVEVIEKRQGYKVGCIEEIAFKKGLIGENQLRVLGNSLKKNSYGQYLLDIIKRQN